MLRGLLFLLPVFLCLQAVAQPGTGPGPGTPSASQSNTPELRISGLSAQITSVAYSPDGKYLLFGTNAGMAKVWNLATNRFYVLPHNAGINAVAWAPNGGLVATACADNFGYLWTARGKKIQAFEGVAKRPAFMDMAYKFIGCTAVDFSPDGKQVMVAGEGQGVQFWTADEAGEKASFTKLPVDFGGVSTAAYASTGSLFLANQYAPGVWVQDGVTKQLAFTNTAAAAFSPDGTVLALACSAKRAPGQLNLENYEALQPGSTGYVQLQTRDAVFPNLLSMQGPTALEFAPDGQSLVVGTTAGKIELWSVTGQKLRTYKGHSAKIRSLSFAPDGKRFVSASDDGTIRMWSVAEHEHIATLVPASDASSDFIITVPNNYYFSTRPNVPGLSFQLHGKTFPLAQFDVQYNRPAIVLKRLGYSSARTLVRYEAARQKRLELLGLTEDATSRQLEIPTLEVDRAAVKSYTSEPAVRFSVRSTTRSTLLTRLHVMVNGVPIYGRVGKPIRGTNAAMSVDVQLSDGNNSISVWTGTREGGASHREQFSVFFEGPQQEPSLYLVGIAAATFTSEFEAHNFNAAADVESVLRAYEQRQGHGFKKVETHMLQGENVNRQSVAGLKNVLAKAGTDDVVMVYFTGHGLLDEATGNYFLSAYNINFNDPAQGGIPFVALEDLMDNVPSRKRLMLINACNSGEHSDDPKTFQFMRHTFADLRQNSGAYVISSSRSIESSFTSGEGTSVFGQALLDILADSEAIRASELKALIHDKVKRKQTPTMRQENPELDFRVW